MWGWGLIARPTNTFPNVCKLSLSETVSSGGSGIWTHSNNVKSWCYTNVCMLFPLGTDLNPSKSNKLKRKFPPCCQPKLAVYFVIVQVAKTILVNKVGIEPTKVSSEDWWPALGRFVCKFSLLGTTTSGEGRNRTYNFFFSERCFTIVCMLNS